MKEVFFFLDAPARPFLLGAKKQSKKTCPPKCENETRAQKTLLTRTSAAFHLFFLLVLQPSSSLHQQGHKQGTIDKQEQGQQKHTYPYHHNHRCL